MDTTAKTFDYAAIERLNQELGLIDTVLCAKLNGISGQPYVELPKSMTFEQARALLIAAKQILGI